MIATEGLHVAEVVTYPVKSLPGVSRPEGAVITENGLEGDRLFTLAGVGDPEGVAPRLTLRECPELTQITPAYRDGGVELNAPGHDSLWLPGNIIEGKNVRVRSWGGEVTGVHVSDEASAWLSSVIGREAQILAVPDSHRRTLSAEEQHPDVPTFTGRGTDGYPLHVVSPASLRRFNEARVEQGLEAVGIESFRANVIVDGETLAPFAEDAWERMLLANEDSSLVELIALRACARCKTIEANPKTGRTDGNMLKTLSSLRDERGQKELIFGVWAAPSIVSVGGLLRAGQVLHPA